MVSNLLEPLEDVGRAAGGEAGVGKILAAFYKKMASDPLVGFFFHGKDLDHIISQQTMFISRAMGLRPTYKGKSPHEAHRNIPPILKGHFDRRLVILRETLEEFHLPQHAIEAWINFEDTFRKGIVEPEGPLSQRKKYQDRKNK